MLFFCGAEERFLPCIDFGHLNARTLGGLSGKADFAAVLDAVRDRLGEEQGPLLSRPFFPDRVQQRRGKTPSDLCGALGFGPEPGPLMELVAERALTPVVICESAGTQAEDAAAMRDLWRAARGA